VGKTSHLEEPRLVHAQVAAQRARRAVRKLELPPERERAVAHALRKFGVFGKYGALGYIRRGLFFVGARRSLGEAGWVSW